MVFPVGKKVIIKSLVDNINQSYNLQSYYLCISIAALYRMIINYYNNTNQLTWLR